MNTIRLATFEDVSEILRIENECFDYDAMTEEDLLGFLPSKDHAVYVKMSDLNLIEGYMIIEDEDYIYSVATELKAQGRGIGNLLIKYAQAHYPKLTLHVKTFNLPANRLYTRHGFKEVGRCEAYYDDGTDALIYRWER